MISKKQYGGHIEKLNQIYQNRGPIKGISQLDKKHKLTKKRNKTGYELAKKSN